MAGQQLRLANPNGEPYVMWDPDAKTDSGRWWESPDQQAMFVRYLREMLGLAPIPNINPKETR